MGGAFENGSASLFSQSFNGFGERSAMGRGGSSSSFSYDGASRIAGIGHDLFNVAGQPSPDVNWTFGYNPSSQLASQSRDNDSYAWTMMKSHHAPHGAGFHHRRR